jgi:hypothetical protein
VGDKYKDLTMFLETNWMKYNNGRRESVIEKTNCPS